MDTAHAEGRDRHQRRAAALDAGWVDPRVRAESAADGLHRHRNHDGRADHRRATRSPAGSVPAPRRSRARRLWPFPCHRPARPGRSRGWNRDAAAGGLQDHEGGRLGRIAFEPSDVLGDKPAGYARKGGSWAVNVMRDTERLPRNAVLAAATPFGFAVGHRARAADRSSRRHYRAGHRTVPRLGHRCGESARGRRSRAEAAPDPRRAGIRTHDGADRRSRQRVPGDRAAVEGGARHAGGATQGAGRSQDPVDAGDAGAAPRSSGPPTSCASAAVFRRKGERVYAGTPRSLPAMRDDLPINRLGLARWLVDPGNPLVARVAVNRLWEQLFGRGLVETSEDFGDAGCAADPSRAARLAGHRVRGQALEPEGAAAHDRAVVHLPAVIGGRRPALVERDPYNRLLARGPRFRLEAEMIRDATLAVSGLLSDKMRGPSVFPLQPDGIWNMPVQLGQVDRVARARTAFGAASTRSGGAPRRIRAS